MVVEVFSLKKKNKKKDVHMLEEVVEGWQEVRSIYQVRQKLVAQFVQLLKHWSCDVRSGIVMEKNWSHSVDQCKL